MGPTFVRAQIQILVYSIEAQLQRGVGGLGGDLHTQNLFQAVSLEFCRFGSGSDRRKSRPNGSRITPSLAQDDSRMFQVSEMSIFGPFNQSSEASFPGLGNELLKNSRRVKTSQTNRYRGKIAQLTCATHIPTSVGETIMAL